MNHSTVTSWNAQNLFTAAAGDLEAYQEKVTELAAVISAAATNLVMRHLSQDG